MIGALFVSVMRIGSRRLVAMRFAGFVMARAGRAVRLTQDLRANPKQQRNRRKAAGQRTQCRLTRSHISTKPMLIMPGQDLVVNARTQYAVRRKTPQTFSNNQWRLPLNCFRAR